jgi:hypothetical protein
MNYMGKEYTEVKDRIASFLKDYPPGMIQTTVDWHSEDFSAVCIKAFIYPDKADQTYLFTGLAYEERVTTDQVNRDAWVENCETSAIGRALANMNIGVNFARPSAEEMKKVTKREKPKFSEPFNRLNASLDQYKVGGGYTHADLITWKELHEEELKGLPDNEKNILRKLYIELESGATK